VARKPSAVSSTIIRNSPFIRAMSLLLDSSESSPEFEHIKVFCFVVKRWEQHSCPLRPEEWYQRASLPMAQPRHQVPPERCDSVLLPSKLSLVTASLCTKLSAWASHLVC
jgi:hypothetical protein